MPLPALPVPVPPAGTGRQRPPAPAELGQRAGSGAAPERGEGDSRRWDRASGCFWALKAEAESFAFGTPEQAPLTPAGAHLPVPLLKARRALPRAGTAPRAPRRARTPIPGPSPSPPPRPADSPAAAGGPRWGYVRRRGSDGGRGSAGRSMGEPSGAECRGAARRPRASPGRAPRRGVPRPPCIQRRHCQGGGAAGRLSPPRLPFSAHGRALDPPSRTLTGGGSSPGCPLAFGGGRGQERRHRRSGASRAICLY